MSERWRSWGQYLLRNHYFFFVGLTALMTLFAGEPQLLWRLWRISAAPVSTIGFVAALDCPNHGRVDYSFAVDRNTYRGRQPFVQDSECRALKIGQRIGIDYEREMPENNYAFRATEAEGNRARNAFLTGLVFVSASILLGPLFVAMIWGVASRWALRPR